MLCLQYRQIYTQIYIVLIELFQHVIIMMSSNIKLTRAQTAVVWCSVRKPWKDCLLMPNWCKRDIQEWFRSFSWPFRGACTETVPSVEASDLVSYLVLQTRFLTAKQFKAHKSCNGSLQTSLCVDGWRKSKYGKREETTKHVSSS